MRRLVITSAILILGLNLLAQNSIEAVLLEVERNNTSLAASRKNLDAQIIGNKRGFAPQNPEIEFNYLWGDPSPIGNRTDFSARQSFDFPTAYRHKSRISDLKNEQAVLEYQKQRNEILHQTRLICVKLVLHNAKEIELANRYTNALRVSNAYKAKYSAGEVSVLEFNKARVNLLNVAKIKESNTIERNTLLMELTRLNGGNSVNFTDSLLAWPAIQADFDQWYAQAEANNPLLQWVKQEIKISTQQVKLDRAMSLPTLYGGLMSETVAGQKFQGVTMGITIPLWEDKNSVKHAKARVEAIQSIETDARLQFYNNMLAAHTRVVALQSNVAEFRSELANYSNSELLESAFNKGEISLTQYMYELSLYYETIFTLLEMEMSLNVAIAELSRYQ